MEQLLIPQTLPTSDWKPPNLSDLPMWKDANRISIDIETKDPDLKKLGPGVRRDGYIVGFSFAIEDQNRGYYVPIAHRDGGNVNYQKALQYLKDQVSAYKGIITGANLSYDIDYLMEAGVDFNGVTFRDTQTVEPLLNEHRMRFGLDHLLKEYGLPQKEETLLKAVGRAHGCKTESQIKGMIWKLHSKYIGGYAEYDALGPLRLLRKQEEQIEKENLWQVLSLEEKIQPIAVKLRRRGIRVCEKRLAFMGDYVDNEIRQAVDRVNYGSSIKISEKDLQKTSALKPLLKSWGIALPKTATGKDSCTKDFLDELTDPKAKHLLDARRLVKLRNTYVEGVQKHIVNGRVHSTFKPLRSEAAFGSQMNGSIGGRFSSVMPNMQNQPARDKVFAAAYRSIFIPEDGGRWCTSDYSSQEPRLTLHCAEALKLPGAKEMADYFRQCYKDNTKADLHLQTANLAGISRKDAKAIFLGLCYGMGDAKLCHSLGFTTVQKLSSKGHVYEVAGPEGEAFLKKFNKMVPFLSGLKKAAQDAAERRGYIMTINNRKLRFRKGHEGYEKTYKALNKISQGGSACQMKLAMVACDEAGLITRLQVHDELGHTIYSDKEAQLIDECMVNAVKLTIPTVVDTEIGPSFGEIDEEGRQRTKQFYARMD